jgi:hypothetical protein
MNRTHRSTPPKPTPDLLHESEQDFGDSRNTSWALHTQVLVHQNSLNHEESKDFRQEHTKPYDNENPKIEPLFSRIWEGNRKEKNNDGFMHTSPNKSPRKQPRNLSKKITKKRLRKSPKRQNWEELKQALRNHAESSIHTMKVHTRSTSRPIILPSHKISP